MKLVYSDQAKEDLLAIQIYISKQSGHKKTGADFVKSLRKKCKELASYKGILGIERSELSKNLRCQPFKKYIIFYEYREESFFVVTIIEGHRDFYNLF